MECAVIVTYRCNARCQMCHTWKHPSDQAQEITPEIIDKIPLIDGKYKRLNITGGEPMLREDILDIVEILSQKAERLEISTNGYYTEKILQVAEKFPDITIRVSVEGLPEKNDRLRGLKHGFDHSLRTIIRLKDMGLKNIGFAIVINDKNVEDLLDLYHLCEWFDVEFSNSTMHNSFYFHKHDNEVQNLDHTIAQVNRFIEALLTSKRKNVKMRLKDWGRAYINWGLMNYLQGNQRSIPCGAGTDSYFLDPFGQVLACNGSDEPWVMGNLNHASFDEIWRSKQAEEARKKVKACTKNCWMMGTAVPAMRSKPWIPARWIASNKLKLVLGKSPFKPE